MDRRNQPEPGASADALRAERNQLQQRIKLLESSLTLATARLERAQRQTGTQHTIPLRSSGRSGISRLLNRTSMTATGFLLLGSLTSFSVFQDARSTINNTTQYPLAIPASNAVAADTVVADSKPAAPPSRKNTGKKKKKPPKTGKGKKRFAAGSPPQHRQWGPALFMQDTPETPRHYLFDPLVQQQQQDLLTLGFDVGEADGFGGPRTTLALEEFSSLYLSGGGLTHAPEPGELATLLASYADLARADAASFNIDRGIVAAIRLSSVRTGIEFPYLMELAAAESNFDPVSRAASSSATGLYQFTRDTWLNTIKKHGEKYGLESYAAQIEFYMDSRGNRRPMVRDERVRQHLLELRTNPRISAMMAAESVRDNQQLLRFSLNRQPGRTDLYLMHFLGNAGAISFLKALDEDPGVPAVELFPVAARSNKNIFHPRTCGPRTLNDVYELFGKKFDTSLYEGD